MPALTAFVFFLNILPYLLSLAITVAVAIFTYRRRGVTGARSFSAILGLETAWIFGYIFEMVSPSLVEKAFWDNFQWIGSLLAPVAICVFALDYTRRVKLLTRRWIGLLITIALGFILMIIINPVPRWGIGSPLLIEAVPFSAYTYQFGLVIWLASIYGYLLSIIGILILS